MADGETLRRLLRVEQRLGRLESVERLLSTAGTFTPSFQGTTIAGTFTYSAQEGAYVRLGDMVLFLARLTISAITVAPTGNMSIAGLPLASDAAQPFAAVTLAVVSNIDYRAGVLELSGRITPGESIVRLIETYDNSAAIAYPAASFTNAAASVTLSGFYLV